LNHRGQGDRERVSNRLIWLKLDICISKMTRRNYQYIFLKDEGQEGKTGPLWWVPVGGQKAYRKGE
jgi:hypothetical protein